jgi:hypothetical protein
MPDNFEMDISNVIEWANGLAVRHGADRAHRIIECSRPHLAGVNCVCGWLDDQPMPDPEIKPIPRREPHE